MFVTQNVQLQPSKRQEKYFLQACGVARQAYNIMLQYSISEYDCYKRGELEEKPSVSGYSLCNTYNKIKKCLLPYTKDVTKHAPEKAVMALGEAYKRFFNGLGKFPKFKKKKHGVGSFTMLGGTKTDYSYQDRKLKLPGSRKLGLVRTTQKPRFQGKITKITIKQHAGKWYAAISYEMSKDSPILPAKPKQGTVGVDLGIKELAVLSDGTVFENPRAYVRAQAKLRKEQKSLSRKTKGSSNWKKQLLRMQRAHKRVADARKYHLHQLTSHLSKNYEKVVIENLNVSGMKRNRKLSKHISDAGLYEVRRQLTYKCEWYGTELVVADRFFPSSKICSGCGAKKEKLSLSERTYNCGVCGLSIDRDLNAAINLREYDVCSSACGEGSAGSRLRSEVELPSVKQESGGVKA